MKQNIKEKVLKEAGYNDIVKNKDALDEAGRIIELTLVETENKFKGLKGLCDKYRRKYLTANKLFQFSKEKIKRVKFYYKDYISKVEVGKVIDRFYKESDNLQGAKIVIKELKEELGIK